MKLPRATWPEAPALPLLMTTGVALIVAALLYGGWNAVLMLVTLLWLGGLAVFDLRRHEVPHVALVLLPYLAAASYALWRGDGALSLAALSVLAASERQRLPTPWRPWALAGAGLACLAPVVLEPELLAGALALLGFWLMFEWNWWAGMDAMAAITLVLLWPDLGMVLAIGAGHLSLALYHRRPITWPRRLTPEELLRSGRPGFPALALGVAVYLLATLLAG